MGSSTHAVVSRISSKHRFFLMIVAFHLHFIEEKLALHPLFISAGGRQGKQRVSIINRLCNYRTITQLLNWYDFVSVDMEQLQDLGTKSILSDRIGTDVAFLY